MAVFKCKMCGGNIEFNSGDTVGTCDSCGSVQTLPKVNDDAVTVLYNRANNLRLKSEFDKAAEIYGKILNQDDSNAEAHWGLVLCKYGIEYVEDPATYRMIPTCHRAQYESVMTDVDYIAALENSDTTQQGIYTQQALEISSIQKGILAIVKDEKPFDVFICYKETDENGKRTVDSALANDIYYQLTQEGLKVFYAAITLEDKLGQEYEPYIFAALNSAKVMLVVGTKPEYFDAVWVKNEWSRFLKIMGTDRSKLLIPCYRDMDAYDLPEEFAHLQAQDMSKIGFINDVVRGVKKVIDGAKPKTETVKETVVVNNGGSSSNVNALLDRGFMALEDGEFEKADGFFEEALNQDAKNAQCYLGKLMAELKVKTKDDLKNCAQPFDDKNNCIKASKFSGEIAEELKADNDFIRERITSRQNAIQKAAENAIGAFVALKSSGNLAEIEKKISRLEELMAEFPAAKEKADSLNNQLEMTGNKIHELKSKLSGLGLFAGKEKKQLKELIEEESKKEKELKTEAIVANHMLGGYSDIPEIEQEITELKEKVEKLKEKTSLPEDEPCNLRFETVKEVKEYLDAHSEIKEIALSDKHFRSLYYEIGDIIEFGKYSQSNKETNEPIKWRILDKQGNKMLIISAKALDRQQYNTEKTDVTWETCSLRKWMNNEFYNAAFETDEQNMIASAKVTADANPSYSTNPGNDTTDKVFLLSINEVNKYFSSDNDRMCVPTKYAVSNEIYTSDSYTKDGEATCWWWLRSPGYYSYDVASVNLFGGVNYLGSYVNSDYDCVRPALWIEI